MGASTKVSRIVRAPRRAIYRACLDPDALASWRVPDGMTARVHTFDGREGGSYRMSLTYADPADSPGKTTGDTDTFQGTFIALVPDEKVVELIRFESPDPAFAGEMRMTTSLAEADQGTEVTVLCENVPPGIRPEDNELGCRLALANLARLVEQRPRADKHMA